MSAPGISLLFGRSPTMTTSTVRSRRFLLAAFALVAVATLGASLEAGFNYVRHYYGGWSYYPQRTYYYTQYYYYPTTTSTSRFAARMRSRSSSIAASA